MEKLVNEILHFGGYYNEGYKEKAEFELENMSDDEQRKLLSDLENNHVHFGYQVFSRYLTKEEINKFNEIVIACGGDLQEACYRYPYAYMHLDFDHHTLVFDDELVNDESLQSVINMMHVVNAKRKFDPEYRASIGLPPIEQKPLTMEGLAEQLKAQKGKKDPYKGLDGQRRYMKGMEDEIKKSRPINYFNTPEEKVEQPVSVPKEQKSFNDSIVEGMDIGYDSLVEGGIEDIEQITNPQMQQQQQPMMNPGQIQMGNQFAQDYQVCYGYYIFLYNRAQMGDIMAQQELQMFNPMRWFGQPNNQPMQVGLAGFTNVHANEKQQPSEPVKQNSFMDGMVDTNSGATPSELSVDPSSLIMTEEEEKKESFVYDENAKGVIPPLEVSLRMADQTQHPNAPRPVVQQQQMQTPMSFSNGFTGGNSGFAMPMNMGFTASPTMPPGMTIPTPSMFSPQQQAQANSVKSQLAAMGLKVKKIGGDKPPVSQQAINIDRMCTKHEADGSSELKLSSFGNVLRGGIPVDAGLDQSPADPTTPEGRASIKEYREKVRAEMQRRCTPGAYTPQNMTIYTDAHPEGIHESQPGFAEEKAKMAKSMGLEPMSKESVDALKQTGFKQTAETLAGNGSATYKTPLQIAREKAMGATPIQQSPYMMGMGYQQNVDPTVGIGHIPDDVDNLFFPQMYYPGMGKAWMRPTKEELEAGYSGLVSVSRDGKNPMEKEFKEVEELRRKYKKKIHFYDPKTDGTGVTIVRRPAGETEEDVDEPALNYKEASVLNQMKKEDDIEYKLADALARYNQTMADNLLWFRKNKPLQEYLEVRREAVDQLTRYRNQDPAAPTKNVFMSINDNVTIDDPIHEYKMDELKRMANELQKKAEESSVAGKEKNIIRSYQRQADIINSEAKKSAGIEGDENSVMNIMRRLQALRNIQVISYGDDQGHQAIKNKLDELPPIQIDAHNQYMIWKKLKRGCWDGKPQDFDKAFDKWWYGPRTTTKKQRIEKWRAYKAHMSGLVSDFLNRAIAMQPTKEQIMYQVRSETMKNWREFDQGYMRDDMTTAEFLDAWSFLHARCADERIEEQIRSMKNLYDPKGYMDLVTKSAMQDAAMRGEEYKFTDSKEYNDKRQKFIDAIFHSTPRGTIA